VYIEAAAGLARRVLAEGGGSEGERVAFAFRACLTRAPSAEERARLVALYRQQVGRYRADPAAAHELVSTALGGSLTEGDEPEMAAWTVVSNVLLNLDELLTEG
jgi:hypothetical protein